MTNAAALASDKGHKDENFPVASVLMRKIYRTPVMAFYRFARTADDIADHPEASAAERLGRLATMRATLEGREDGNAAALAFREATIARALSLRHGLDLLTAFERDCVIDRYQDWDALIDYCRYSAMPVGRFVLDVHGESEATWPASDALCAALQVINHLQDCAKDYRVLDRVYLPLDALAATGASVIDLGAPAATPALRATIAGLAVRAEALLVESAGFAAQICDRRLAIEVAVIHRLAVSLVKRLQCRDPLAERVHHRAPEALGIAAIAALSTLARRI